MFFFFFLFGKKFRYLMFSFTLILIIHFKQIRKNKTTPSSESEMILNLSFLNLRDTSKVTAKCSRKIIPKYGQKLLFIAQWGLVIMLIYFATFLCLIKFSFLLNFPIQCSFSHENQSLFQIFCERLQLKGQQLKEFII